MGVYDVRKENEETDKKEGKKRLNRVSKGLENGKIDARRRRGNRIKLEYTL